MARDVIRESELEELRAAIFTGLLGKYVGWKRDESLPLSSLELAFIIDREAKEYGLPEGLAKEIQIGNQDAFISFCVHLDGAVCKREFLKKSGEPHVVSRKLAVSDEYLKISVTFLSEALVNHAGFLFATKSYARLVRRSMRRVHNRMNGVHCRGESKEGARRRGS